MNHRIKRQNEKKKPRKYNPTSGDIESQTLEFLKNNGKIQIVGIGDTGLDYGKSFKNTKGSK